MAEMERFELSGFEKTGQNGDKRSYEKVLKTLAFSGGASKILTLSQNGEKLCYGEKYGEKQGRVARSKRA